MTATIDFRKNAPQQYYCHWRNATRTIRYYGQCPVCGTRLYGAEDGDNDPRGILGYHAVDWLHPAEYGKQGAAVAVCFACLNDTEEKYRRALALAETIGNWK